MRALVILVLVSCELFAQTPRIITTIAGTDYVFPSDGRQARSAPLGNTSGVAVGPQGDVFLSDVDNRMVAVVDREGIIRVIAGNGIPEISGDGGPARSAALRFPERVTLDAGGNIYFVDDNRIRRISSGGIITTVAGGGDSIAEGIPAASARLAPSGVAIASNGDLYISDRDRDRIFVVSNGVLRRYAGGGTDRGDGVPALNALLINPRGIALDSSGALFVSEDGLAENDGGRVRRISPQGEIRLFAGGGLLTADDSPAAQFLLFRPSGLGFDRAGDLYITDESMGTVFKVAGGRIRRIAGNGNDQTSGDGGPATSAGLNNPFAVAIDAGGVIFIAENGGRRIRRVDPSGIITTLAGSGVFRLSGDGGPARSATLNAPYRVVVDGAGNIYFNDGDNHRVRRISPSGIVTTVAGGGSLRDDNIRATDAELFGPYGITVDSAGNLYLAEPGSIRRVNSAGIITTIAGGGDNRGENVPAREAVIDFAADLLFDRNGNLYFAEYTNNRVRRLGTDGRITTVAGNGQENSSGDGGPPLSAGLDSPRGLAFDRSGNLYISENASGRIRRIVDGIISTFAGGGTSQASGIPATQAFLSGPEAITFDSAGNLYVTGSSQVQRVSPTGIITSFAGNGLYEFGGDGGPATAARLSGPAGVAIDVAGNVLIADTANHRIRSVLAATPTFQAAPLTLTFNAQSGGAAPAEQIVTLTSAVPLAYTATVTTATGGNWLSATPLTGALPAALRVTINPANLAQGDYTGTVNIAVAGATPPSVSIQVRLTVTPPLTARPVVDPPQLEFAFVEGAVPAIQQLRVSNSGGGTLSFSTVFSGPGVTVTPREGQASGAQPASITVRVDPAGLTPGTYQGSVLFNFESPQAIIRVPVVIVVGRVTRSLLLSQTGLSFVAVQDGGAVPSQQVAVLNAGQGTLTFTASASALSDSPPWLSVTPEAGQATADSLRIAFLDVRVNAFGLAPGEYFGQVRVDTPDAVNSPQFISVVLSVLRAGSRPPPLVRPSGLVFAGEEGLSPSSQDLFVSNLAATPVNFITGRTPEPPNSLFTVLPAQATVQPDAPLRIVLQPGYTNLTRGIRQGTLTLDFSDGSFQTVRVLLVVVPRGTPPAAVRAAHSSCVPTSLQSEFTLVPKGFTAVTGFPLPMEARVVDDCGHTFTAGSVTASFSNGDPPMSLVHVQDGRWSGTYTPKTATLAPLVIKLSSVSTDNTLRGESNVDGSIRGGTNTPVVGTGGIVNFGNAPPFAPLPPGGIISIYGAGLADQPVAASEQPLTTRLGATEVILQGRRLPLLFVAGQQINAVVPFEVAVNTRLPLVVRRGSAATAVETVTMAPAQPSIITAPGASSPAVYTVQGDLVSAARPARRGEPLVIYCVGLGPVTPPVPDGQTSPGAPVASTTTPLTATIGGRPADVFFAGLTPGFVGLYQVNLAAAADTPSSSAAQLVLTIAGQSSTPVAIPIE
jgi:uncharacterized protein (TIGR03437 family)